MHSPALYSRGEGPPRFTRPICPHALSPFTPESLAGAPTRSFPASSRLHLIPADWPLLIGVTRPNRVCLTLRLMGSLPTRPRQLDFANPRSLRYLLNG